ncbi:MAG: zf-TFIIB domain-containing protein [Dehalococcoidales bacterium]|nr:zf-TFIIB domain-containing protein [Dehalococcoidales bacterium]
MICPVCRHPMIIVEYKKTELDYCPNCHGVWFDKGELELLLESAGAGTSKVMGEITKSPSIVNMERKRKCPICGKKMKKTRVGEKENVLLDVCEQGDGLWFDGGEVDQLVKIIEDKSHQNKEHYHVFNFMKEVFQAPAR